MPAFFFTNEEYIHGIVMANYTSGAPVRGNLTLKAIIRPIKKLRYEDYYRFKHRQREYDGYYNPNYPEYYNPNYPQDNPTYGPGYNPGYSSPNYGGNYGGNYGPSYGPSLSSNYGPNDYGYDRDYNRPLFEKYFNFVSKTKFFSGQKQQI